MEFEKIIKLVEVVSASSLTGFTLEENGTKLSLEKKPEMAAAGSLPLAPVNPAAPAALAGAAEGLSVVKSVPVMQVEKIVKAPLVGTFYTAPSEDAEPFVKTGDSVKKGQVLGIIEAMKLMNEIESEYDGVIEAVLISNEQVVEYGQPLFRIRQKG